MKTLIALFTAVIFFASCQKDELLTPQQATPLAALSAKGSGCIQGIECIAKTYPGFCEDFSKIGAQIDIS